MFKHNKNKYKKYNLEIIRKIQKKGEKYAEKRPTYKGVDPLFYKKNIT